MSENTRPKRSFDFLILMTVLILLTIGTIMVLSSGAPHAYSNLKGDAYFFLKKQIVYVPLSILAMIFTMNVDYRKIGKISPILLLGSIILLALVLIPGVGKNLNGATRWISIGGQTIQPSEIAKIAAILFFSFSLSKRKDELKYFLKGLLPYLGVLGFIALLIMKEPHMSGTLVICGVIFIILFAAGAKISHFIMVAIPAAIGVVFLIIKEPYRMSRVMSFLDPWKDVKGGSYQVIQSLYALGSGGWFGKGLGKSIQKYLYIPEPYNDFILSVLAEELGYFGVISVLVLFLVFIWRGLKIAVYAPDTFGSLVATGITSLVGIQVVLNVLVITSSMPPTGVPLPFFSYGGTSLIFLMSGVGILLNISRYANYDRI